jgi:hypothetical protein
VGGNIEMQNSGPVMGQHQENVKNLQADGGDGEEIDGDQLLDMILEEGALSLRRRFMAAQHVFADAALSDVDAKFEQFAMDAGCTPAGILPAHLADQISDFTRKEGSSGFLRRTCQVQNRGKPARCQDTTVSGLTMASAERQLRRRRERPIHNRRSQRVSFGRVAADP